MNKTSLGLRSTWNGFSKKKKLLLGIILELMILAVLVFLFKGAFAEEELWELKVDGETITVMQTEADAKESIALVKSAYTEDDATNVTVKVDPTITVEKRYYGKMSRKPKTTTPEIAADVITGDDDISEALVEVTTTQTVTESKKVSYKTIEKESEEVAQNTVAVKSEGKKGTSEVTVKKTSVNGKEVSSTVKDEEVVEEPENRVVLTGAMNEAGAKGTTNTHLGTEYSKEAGQAVADYALKWVGNPYKYGGISLTNGADCSGFVLSVYKHFGIDLPHDAGADRSYGIGVSLSEAQPGDLVCYYGHIGIYIGDGKIVHAMNESHGITVSNVGYSGKKILTVRRLLG